MSKLVYDRVGGQVVHVGDCQVWAEIFYLDSPTDYREFLPQKPRVVPATSDEGLVMLDELHSRCNSGGLSWLLPILMVFLVGFILYFAFGI